MKKKLETTSFGSVLWPVLLKDVTSLVSFISESRIGEEEEGQQVQIKRKLEKKMRSS